jgi:heme/copper-type cytochrome/quinol oxidase subunit 3
LELSPFLKDYMSNLISKYFPLFTDKEVPHTVQARPDTGLYSAKLGIWLFLASEVMLFGGFAQLIVTWLIRVTGTPLAPAFYVMFGAVVGTAGVMLMVDHYKEETLQ